MAQPGLVGGLPVPAQVPIAAPLPAPDGRRIERGPWSPEERRQRGLGVARKPTRTLSGVAIVAVMTSPARCPHGRCTYCPGGIEARSPQAYTGEEPAALRGAQFGYDARAITAHRLDTLESVGHPTSKVEVILMGGTFPARPWAYQESVLRGVYDGLNGTPSATIEEAQRRNESGAHRLVGLTVETRPDRCDPATLLRLLDAGVTRVELGVECLRDPVLAQVGRAHTVEEVVHATRTARDAGLKVGYHLMPGLPGMDPARDEEDFVRLFNDPGFRPDFLKIYPTLVLPGTPLHADWVAGRYAPYDARTAADLLARVKARLPPWVRIQRIQRDIPARLIAAGVRSGNLRQLALRRLAEMGGRCRCLRCREAGRLATPPPDSYELTRRSYEAGGGREEFLSFEDPASDALAGFLRLRFPASEVVGFEPVIRELKVLGAAIPVGSAPLHAGELQHRGFGQRLLRAAEELACDAGANRIRVTSGVGTREYYARLGYLRDGPNQVRELSPAR
jgi:elongator complex protein 3